MTGLGAQQRPLRGLFFCVPYTLVSLHLQMPSLRLCVIAILGHTSLCGKLVLGITRLYKDLEPLLLDAIAPSPRRCSWVPW